MSLLAKGVFTSLLLFGGSSYLSFKHNEYQKYIELIDKAQNEGGYRAFLHEIHKKITNISEIPPNTSLPKETHYRKVLFSYSEGVVLETGVGLYDHIKDYPQNLQKVIAIDWVRSNIEQGVIKNKFPKREYLLDDCEKMSFEDNTFDTVVDVFGLQYYANPEKALQEIKRVCKNDGKILILAKGRSFYWVFNVYLDWINPRFLCKYGMSINKDWNEIIEKQGFQMIRSERKVNGCLYFYILQNKKQN